MTQVRFSFSAGKLEDTGRGYSCFTYLPFSSPVIRITEDCKAKDMPDVLKGIMGGTEFQQWLRAIPTKDADITYNSLAISIAAMDRKFPGFDKIAHSLKHANEHKELEAYHAV